MTLAQRVNIALRRIPAWPVYLSGGLLPLWYLYLGATGALGVEPINGLEREFGELALITLVVVLAVTPVRQLTGISLVKHRRALGLLAFYFVLWHLLVWIALDVRDAALIWIDIVKRPYITIGMVAFVLMLPVALTSNDRSIRWLGPLRWRRLHMLTYVICVLGAAHYVMLAKTWHLEPLAYLTIMLALVSARLPRLRRSVTK